MPWNSYSKDIFDIPKAEKILNKNHFGLEDIKKKNFRTHGGSEIEKRHEISDFVFSEFSGVGKTSLGKSIADALGRKYVRMSLGGLHDESEIRGHRKTYISAQWREDYCKPSKKREHLIQLSF